MYLLLYTADKISHDPNWTRQLLLEVWHSWRLGFRLRICRSAHKKKKKPPPIKMVIWEVVKMIVLPTLLVISYCGLYDYCYYYMGLLWDFIVITT